MQRYSLRQISIFGVGLGILLPALVFGYFMVLARYEREVQLRVRNPMVQYADMLAKAMEVPIWNVDKEVGRQFVNGVMHNPEVVSIAITDEAGSDFVKQKKDMSSGAALITDTRPVILDSKIIGKVEISLTTANVKHDLLEDIAKQLLGLGAQVLFSFALIWFLFDRRIVRPIRILQQETARLASGQMDQALAWTRQDEIGNLAQGLDKMRLNLGELIAGREHQNALLQQELAERLRVEQILRETEEKFIAIFQASPVAMTVFRKNPSYRMADVNDAWVRQFGWSHETILGQVSMQEYLWRNMDDFHHVVSRLERDGEIHGYEAWCRSGIAGRLLLCELSGRLVRIAEETMLILVQEDITEKRQNEQAIRNMNATLEKRVSERTHELEEANSELTVVLEDLQRAQQELLRTEKMAALGSLVAGVAHELNTPIGTSVTVASTLQQQTTEIYQQFQQGLRKSVLEEYLSNARLGTDLLLRNLSKASELVASFKQVAVDRTSANRRQFALDEMMDELIVTLGPMIRKTPHEVTADIPAKMLLDSYPGALGQVMTNLINNAFIHAFDPEVRGRVCIEAHDKDHAFIEITVTDNGKGIAPANIGRIFDPFFTTRLGQGGSGLGLNIVYNLVKDVLGGDIRVSSTVGEGTRFSMSIPKTAKIAETPH
ncbi:ATP-binding protein [Undibacterium rugosum]|uniref:histidine kinase n=1 Tax=Undibacterium rugosum TaxID=2762291 RepID=A0A923IBB8_9BURK|nr:ATP-binding protein [Undibacterium rugosum]MBC3936090.1 PAS domain S-box protein [Undibacterium rugosum]MBR7779275.1 PAS domain S-box protein [Undibacterium rugosum]